MDTANMTNQEIDRAVAEKVMGWKEGETGLLWTPTYHTIAEWSPSTSIEQAFEVITKWREEGDGQSWAWIEIDAGGRATCKFCGEFETSSRIISAPTAPLAICCAALDAVERE